MIRSCGSRVALGVPAAPTRTSLWWGAVGQAGAGIEQVIVEVPSQPSAVVAWLENGWFVFWTPLRPREQYRIVGLNAAGEEVASLHWAVSSWSDALDA